MAAEMARLEAAERIERELQQLGRDCRGQEAVELLGDDGIALVAQGHLAPVLAGDVARARAVEHLPGHEAHPSRVVERGRETLAEDHPECFLGHCPICARHVPAWHVLA